MNEAMKLEIVRALGLWAASLDVVHDDAVEQFIRGLKEKETLQKAHLKALLQVRRIEPCFCGMCSCTTVDLLTNDGNEAKDYILQVLLGGTFELRASAQLLLAPLTKVAAEGSAKAAQRSEGIAAALGVALIAGAGGKSDKGIDIFWSLLAPANAPLLSLSTFGKLPTEEAAYAVSLAETLLMQVSSTALFIFPAPSHSYVCPL
jgi:hypothetical protein